jgi:hypothetical protein
MREAVCVCVRVLARMQPTIEGARQVLRGYSGNSGYSQGALGTQSTHREPSSVVGLSGVRADGAGPASAIGVQRVTLQRNGAHHVATAALYNPRVATAALYNPRVATAASHHSVLQCIAAPLRRATAALQRIIAPLLRRRVRCNGCATWRARLRRGEMRGERQRQRRVEGVVPEGTRQYSSVLWETQRYSGVLWVLWVLCGALRYSGVLWNARGARGDSAVPGRVLGANAAVSPSSPGADVRGCKSATPMQR